MNTTPAMGHNNPPSDAEILQEKLRERHAILMDNADKLVGRTANLPDKCDDDEMAGKLGDFIKLVTGTQKSAEGARVAEKEPFLAGGRAVDGFFKLVTDKLEATKRKAQKPLDDYLTAKAAAERRRRDEEAKRLREQAQAEADAAATLAAANLPKQADETMTIAARSELKASNMEASVSDRPSTMAQTRGTTGSVATLRTRWVGEIIERDQLDLEALRAHIPMDALQKAVNSFVTAGGRTLPGARIFEKSEAVVR